MLKEEESVFDFRQLWQLCLSNWYWILGSMVACVLIAGIYLWFATSTVTVTGKMEIIDKHAQQPPHGPGQQSGRCNGSSRFH